GKHAVFAGDELRVLQLSPDEGGARANRREIDGGVRVDDEQWRADIAAGRNFARVILGGVAALFGEVCRRAISRGSAIIDGRADQDAVERPRVGAKYPGEVGRAEELKACLMPGGHPTLRTKAGRVQPVHNLRGELEDAQVCAE